MSVELFAFRLSDKLDIRPRGLAAAGRDRMSLELKFHDLVSLRRALDERLRALELDLRRVAGDIPAQVEKRKALAQSLELSRRLLEMYEPVQHSPSWIKTGASLVCEPVSNPVSRREGKEEVLEFESRHNTYSLRFKRISSDGSDPESSNTALISFCDVGGRTLFAVSVQQEQDAHGRHFRPLDIEVFIPSNWIKDFLELSEEIAALQREMEIRKKYDPAELEKLKKHFGL